MYKFVQIQLFNLEFKFIRFPRMNLRIFSESRFFVQQTMKRLTINQAKVTVKGYSIVRLDSLVWIE